MTKNQLPESFAHCSLAMSRFKIDKDSLFQLPVLNQLRADIFYTLVKNPDEQVFTTNFKDVLELTTYDYKRDPKLENLSEEDIRSTLDTLLSIGIITKLKITGDIIKYRISDVLTVVSRGETEVLRSMLGDKFTEVTNSSKDLLKVLQLILLRSSNKEREFNDTVIQVGEFFAGKTKGSKELGISTVVFANSVNELLNLNLIDTTAELEINGHPYFKYILTARFNQDIDYFHVPFSWTDAAKKKEIDQKQELEEVTTILTLGGDAKVTLTESAEVIKYFDKILPKDPLPDLLENLKNSKALSKFMEDYSTSSLLLAFNKVIEEFPTKKFENRNAVHERLKYYLKVYQGLETGETKPADKPETKITKESNTVDIEDDIPEEFDDFDV